MIERDIGRHEEAISSLKREVHAMRDELGEIKEILATAKGGWKTLMAVGTISSAFTAVAFKVIAFIKGGA